MSSFPMPSPLEHSYTWYVDLDRKKVRLDVEAGRLSFPYDCIEEAHAGEETQISGDIIRLKVNVTDNDFLTGEDKTEPRSVLVKTATMVKFLGKTSQEVEKLIQEGKLEKAIGETLAQEPPIPPDVRAKIIKRLDEFKLTIDEFEEIEQFYLRRKKGIEEDDPSSIWKAEKTVKESDVSLFISRRALNIPRSCVFIPDGPFKGMHILLKSHSGMEELGIGASNIATVALSLDTGEKEVFRTGQRSASEEEAKIMKALQGYESHFAIGAPVVYVNGWRPRKGREKNVPKTDLLISHPGQVVEKRGFIMPFFPTSLKDQIMNWDFSQKIKAAGKLVEGLVILQDLGLVHRDLKPANILVTEGGDPKIADFGLAEPIGKTGGSGSPGYMSPEAAMNKTRGASHPINGSSDIWSFGCILAEMFHGKDWRNFTEQTHGNWDKLIDMKPEDLNKELERLFPAYANLSHPDSIIYRCLQKNPNERISPQEISEALSRMKVVNG
jgi:hypothetical protein